jgi:hypothetical protein
MGKRAYLPDLGFAFHCSVVSAHAYWNGAPL